MYSINFAVKDPFSCSFGCNSEVVNRYIFVAEVM